MKVSLDSFLQEINEKTTINNQYPVLTSAKSGLYLQRVYFNKSVASNDNTGYKIIRRGQFTYRAMSDTGEFFPNMLECAEIGIVSPAYPVFAIKDSNIVLPEYLKYYFKTNKFQHSIASFAQGSTRTSVKFDKLKTVSINLPDINEQRKAIDNLNRIKSLIVSYEKELQKLEELVKARFVELFGDKYSLVKLGDVIQTTSGGTPSKAHSEYFTGGTIPWLTSGEINAGVITSVKNFITEEGMKNSSAKLVPANSVVIAMYGATAGVTGIIKIETTTNQAVCSLLPNNRFIPEYLYYAVSSQKDWMISQCRGGGQPNISQGIIKNMDIIDAPISAQQEFADFVTQVDKVKFAVQESLNKTQLLFDSLMQQYFG